MVVKSKKTFVGRITDAAKRFWYDATFHSPLSPGRYPLLRNEDHELDYGRRRIAVSTSRDIVRNFSIVGWAVRRHCNFVSQATFQSKIGDVELNPRFKDMPRNVAYDLNQRVEELIWDWGRPENFCVDQRIGIDEFMWQVEHSRTVDGDVGVLKTRDGRVQIIEGDRIRNESLTQVKTRDDDTSWYHGVLVDGYGRHLAYKVWRRLDFGGSHFKDMDIVSSRHLFLHGYNFRGSNDQVRGVSPLMASVKAFEDLYEGFDAALKKANLSHRLAYSLTMSNEYFDLLNAEKRGRGLGEEAAAFEENRRRREVVMRDMNAYWVNLREGEEIKPITSDTPTMQFQSYAKKMTEVSLKCLDIPYSMYDETVGKFYGNRAALNAYLEDVKPRRASHLRLLNNLTKWRLNYEVARGNLELPLGMTADDIYFHWQPNGLPWWNEGAEIETLDKMVQFGFASRSEVCQMLGKDYKEVIRQQVADRDYAADVANQSGDDQESFNETRGGEEHEQQQE